MVVVVLNHVVLITSARDVMFYLVFATSRNFIKFHEMNCELPVWLTIQKRFSPNFTCR